MVGLWNIALLLLACSFYCSKLAFCDTDIKDTYNPSKLINDVLQSQTSNLNSSENDLNDSKNVPPEFPHTRPKPMDCADYLQLGYEVSGLYRIWPRNRILYNKSILVYCDMKTDDGGWTVLQRRGDYLRPNDYFSKDWVSYKNGFGDIEKDFWLGNDNIYALTNQRAYSVRFDLTDVEGAHLYALYDVFYIENEEMKYKLTIEDYSGTANDSMIAKHNGSKFTTKDENNDDDQVINCALFFEGGWWYNSCHYANLNGLYLNRKDDNEGKGIVWTNWNADYELLYKTEIKIRPKNFRWLLI